MAARRAVRNNAKKVVMIFPSHKSEKAINGYSQTLTDEIRKNKRITDITYTAGKPMTLFKQCKKIRSHDVVHIQHEYNLLGKFGIPFFMLYSRLFFSKCKIVTTMHTVLSQNENFRSGKFKTFLRKILYRAQNKIIKSVSDKVIVHAQFFKDILVDEYGFDDSKIKVIPQAIIEDVPIMNKETAKKKFKLKGSIYLMIGSFVPDHGADIIIDMADKIDGTILIVASPTTVNDRNETRVDSFLKENVQRVKTKNVRFDIAPITDKNLEWWQYFCAADLVLLPYRGGIGSGIFAHAMATRTPVIASDIKFFNEIGAKSNCLKVAYNNEYPEMIKEAMNGLRNMELDCERYRQKFGISNLARSYIDLYFSL